jgi:hypothetical protein
MNEKRFQTQDNFGREKYTNANRKIFQVRDPDITGNFRVVQDTASTATSG